MGLCGLVPWAMERYGDLLPFQIEEVKVEGTEKLSPHQVLAVAGIKLGDPLFGASAQAAPQRLKGVPRVSDVLVIRDLRGRLTLRVREEEPRALVNLNRLYFVDDEGEVLDEASSNLAEAEDLPVITGPWGGKKPEKAHLYQDRFIEAIWIAEILEAQGFDPGSISELHWEKNIGWAVYRTNVTYPVVLGHDRYVSKVRRLVRVLKDFSGREVFLREIDLDYNHRVVVKMKEVT